MGRGRLAASVAVAARTRGFAAQSASAQRVRQPRRTGPGSRSWRRWDTWRSGIHGSTWTSARQAGGGHRRTAPHRRLATVDRASARAHCERRRAVVVRRYRRSLADETRAVLERYRPVDWARRVVGVGSVGTDDAIVLLRGDSDRDPLFLQVKEAQASVLERFAGRSRYRQPRAARRGRAAPDAGRQRHLPRLDPYRATRLLRPPAARHERLRFDRQTVTG
jgi:Uncharacterized protein conserved in bacteria (DUF2252)